MPTPTSTGRSRTTKTPAYRQRPSYDQAIVTLTDARTKKRRDYWLGPYGSPESREAYHRIIAEWEAGDRCLPPPLRDRAPTNDDVSVAEVMRRYWDWARQYYSASEVATIRAALRIVREVFGSTPAKDFGPNRLRLVRDRMVAGDPDADPPRRPWSRKHVNGQIHRVAAMYKWAAAHELLPASVYHQLKTVPSLKRGRSAARETEGVGPVAVECVEAVRPYLSPQVNALISLQLHTGARGGELFSLRPIDLAMDDRSGTWTVTPLDHKTAHHNHSRTIYLGPRAQAVVRPFLAGRPVDAYLFSPTEAESERRAGTHAARKTPLSCGNRPGTNRVTHPRKRPGEHYTAASYRRAIERACDLAFPPPDHLRPRARDDGRLESRTELWVRLTEEQRGELRTWRHEHRWHPHQLRHTTATQIRREFGLEAARIALGHSSALVTDAVYAERDMARVIEVMKQIG